MALTSCSSRIDRPSTRRSAKLFEGASIPGKAATASRSLSATAARVRSIVDDSSKLARSPNRAAATTKSSRGKPMPQTPPLIYPKGAISPAVVQPKTGMSPNLSRTAAAMASRSYCGEQKTTAKAMSGPPMRSWSSAIADAASGARDPPRNNRCCLGMVPGFLPRSAAVLRKHAAAVRRIAAFGAYFRRS